MGGKEIQSPPNMDTNGFREENLQGKTCKKKSVPKMFPFNRSSQAPHLPWFGCMFIFGLGP